MRMNSIAVPAGVLGITAHEINEQIDQPRRVERKNLGKEQRRR